MKVNKTKLMEIKFLIALLVITILVKAQDTTKHAAKIDSLEVVTKVSPGTVIGIPSSYPGGQAAWNKFLISNMRYPDRAYTKGAEGVVIVEFSIDTNGMVSDIKAISGPSYGGLRDEAIRLIKISGKWIPAYQWENNVRTFVKSQKRQPFLFKIGG